MTVLKGTKVNTTLDLNDDSKSEHRNDHVPHEIGSTLQGDHQGQKGLEERCPKWPQVRQEESPVANAYGQT